MKTVYLDNNATTRIAPEVLDAMSPYLGELYGNPSSMHAFGHGIRKALDEARQKVAGLIGAEPEEIIFTGSGTEGDNTAIMSAVSTSKGKDRIVTTAVEHHAVLNFIRRLEGKGRAKAVYLPVDGEGRLDMDAFRKSIDDKTALVSVMFANNETGVIFPIEEIGKVLREKGIVFHTDAVQAVGKVAIDVKKLGVDMLSLSGHKLHAPKGVGALYVRRGLKFSPYLIGGGQERGRRAGTENVASIVGLGRACELAGERLDEEARYIGALRDRLEEGFLRLPDAMVNGDRVNRLPNTTNMSFHYVDGEAILMKLNELGICVSTGSACASGSPEPSHVLRAMSVPPTAIRGSIRFSLSRYNTESEIDTTLDAMAGIVKEIRALSTYGPQK